MLKTKLISHTDPESFEKTINDFIKDKYVVNMYYQSFVIHTEWRGNVPVKGEIVNRVLIAYEDSYQELKKEEQPSDDAMDVVRAKWHTTTDPVNGTVTFVCTHCGETITIPSMGAIPYATCPGCHAIMF